MNRWKRENPDTLMPRHVLERLTFSQVVEDAVNNDINCKNIKLLMRRYELTLKMAKIVASWMELIYDQMREGKTHTWPES